MNCLVDHYRLKTDVFCCRIGCYCCYGDKVIPSNNVVTLAEAIVNHYLKRSLETGNCKNIFKLNTPRFSPTREGGATLPLFELWIVEETGLDSACLGVMLHSLPLQLLGPGNCYQDFHSLPG